ncbi:MULTISPECIES: DedA family protein [unclassified Rhizobium]|uniref:DedA family protein n=1 Tax=unclassified Rhizobium TaxID=2613769 RepID=UPI000EAA6272|nr:MULTISPECIES: DedA family protein [unclassified Rhizobium]AYG69446.1 DedA family protein [Rhizobium sp. CCGE531]AYG75825.1 DedA family protein [Rhizobium sp. CCGE532]
MNDPSDLLGIVPDLASWGLLGLVLCSTVEKLLPIIPSIGMFIMLGMLSVTNSSDLPAAIAITAAGSTAGSLFWYGMGRWLGAARGDVFVMKMSRHLDIKDEWYWRLKSHCRRHRVWVAFVGQLIPVIRAYMAFPAGVLAIPAPGFAIATFFGAVVWNAPFLASGYMLRKQVFAQDTATSAAFAAIMLVYLLLFALFRLCRPSRNAA